jgi:hypothetical protein
LEEDEGVSHSLPPSPKVLDRKLMDNSVLITDENNSFKAFVRENLHFNHKMIKSNWDLHRDD